MAQNTDQNLTEFISLAEASKQTGYHSDYLGFLCRNGKLKGFKIGRNWVTTQTDLNDFIKNYKNGISEVTDEQGNKIQVHVVRDEVPVPVPATVPVPTTAPAHAELEHLKHQVVAGWENRISQIANEVSAVEVALQQQQLELEKVKSAPLMLPAPVVVPEVATRPSLHQQFISNLEVAQSTDLPVTAPEKTLSQVLNIDKAQQLLESFKAQPAVTKKVMAAVTAVAIMGFVGSVLWTSLFSKPGANSYTQTKIVYQNVPAGKTVVVQNGTVTKNITQVLGPDENQLVSAIDQQLNNYLDAGKFKGQKGDAGQAAYAPITYVQPAISGGNNVTGSMAGFAQLSASSFNADLATLGNLNVSGTANLTGNTNISNLSVGSINPGFTPGSIVFQGSSGLAQDNNNLIYVASTTQLAIGTSTPDASAILELNSTTKGFVGPRMTTAQMLAILNPATGLMVYDTTTNQYNVYNGTSWVAVGSGGGNGSIATGTPGAIAYYAAATASISPQSLLFISGNNLGVGTQTPSSELIVQATGSPTNLFTIASTSGANFLNVDAAGALTVNGPSVFNGNVSLSAGSLLTVGSSTGTPGSLTDGNIYFDSSTGKFNIVEGGVAKTLCNKTDQSCGTGTSAAWSGLSSPTGNLNLSMASSTTNFLWNSATGNSNLFTFNDSANNTGTGTLLNVVTANGSSLNPFSVTASSTAALFVNAAGNVGVGTTTPGIKLTVVGNAYISGSATVASLTQALPVKSTAAGNLFNAAINLNSSDVAGLLSVANGGTGTTTLGNLTLGTNLSFSSGDGKGILIGTSTAISLSSSPSFSGLTVSGSTILNGITYNWPGSQSAGSFLKTDGNGNLTWASTSGGGAASSTGAVGNIQLAGADGNMAADSLFTYDTISHRLSVGTTSSSSTFTLQGQAGNIPLLNVASSSGSSLLTVLANGNVGIGTTAPGSKLTVVGDVYITASATIASLNQNLPVFSTAAGVLYNSLVPNSALQNSFITVSTSTQGLVGGGVVALGGNVNIGLASTGTPGTYGSASQVPVLTTNQFGEIIGVTNTAIALDASAITSGVLGIANGGTGTSTSPSLNQILLGNSAGGYNLVATSSLGFQPVGTYVTAVSGSGSIVSSGGTAPTIQLQNLTSTNILFGQGNNIIGTSSLFTFSAANGLTVGATSTLATTSITSLTVKGNAISGANSGDVTLVSPANGLSLSGQILSVALASSTATGTLSSADWSTFNNKVSSQWTLSGNALFNNLGYQVGINSSTPIANLVVEGTTTNSTLPIFVVASSSNASYLTVLANGNVGIGSTTPTSRLVVQGIDASSVNSALNVTNSSNSSLLFVRNDGNVGIGTTSPQVKLDIQGTNNSSVLNIRNSSGVNVVQIFVTGGSNAGSYTLNDSTGTRKAIISADPADVSYINNGNNFGIGLTNPASTFVVSSSTPGGRGGEITILNPSTTIINSEAALNFAVGSSSYNADNGDAQIKSLTTAANEATDLLFSSWNGATFGERMRIQSTGNVGIGTTTINSRLVLQGSGITSATAVETTYNASGTLLTTILNNGNVGIGTTSPSQLLTVGNNNQFTVSSAGSITVSAFNTAGIVHNSSAGLLSSSLITNSDIQNATIDLTSKVTGVLPVGNGGTGTSTAPTLNQILLGNASGGYSLVSTSTLGINGLTGGQSGYVPYFTSGTTVATSTIIANGSVVGINATSSNYALNVQATAGVKAFNVASSNASSLLNVDVYGNVNVGSLVAPGTPSSAVVSGGTSLGIATTYFYVVTAVDGGGNETIASPETSTTTAGSNRSIKVSWAPVPGAAQYRVYRGTTSAGENVYMQTSDVSLVDTGALVSVNATPPGTNNTILASLGGSGSSWLGGATAGNSLLIAANASSTNMAPVLQLGGGALVSSSTNGTYLGINAPSSFTGNLLDFQNNGVDRFVVTAAGSVGIGSATPGSVLSVQGTSGSSTNLLNVASTSGASYLTVTSGGKVGVGTSNPVSTLAVLGVSGVNPFTISSTTGSQLFAVLQNGNVGIGSSSPSHTLEVVGSIGNTFSASSGASLVSSTTIPSPFKVIVQGKYAYLPNSSNNTISIVDITNPSSPAQVATISPISSLSLNGSAEGAVAVSGNYLYALTTTGALVVDDISNPISPTQIFSSNLDGGHNYLALAVAGKYLYATHTLGLDAYDISNPNSPKFIYSNGSPYVNAYGVAVSGKYVYVAERNPAQFHILDATNPAAPVETGTLNGFGGLCSNPTVISSRYVALMDCSSNITRIVNVSSSTAPSLAASVAGHGNMVAMGRYLVFRDFNSGANTVGISVIDLANPTSPVKIALNSGLANGSIAAIAVSGRYVYAVSTTNNNLQIYDITGTETTALIAHSADIGQLNIRNDVQIAGQAIIQNALTVGYGGILSNGGLAVTSTTSPSYFGGQLSIGTTSTSSMLTLQGQSGINPFNITSSTGASLFQILQNGNVGIGSTTPTALLSVQGTGGSTTDLFSVASSTGSSIFKVLAGNAVQLGMDASSTTATGTVGSTKPVLLLGSTALSSPGSNGTYVGVNAPSGFTGNFVNLQNGGTTQLSINSTGSFAFNGSTAITFDATNNSANTAFIFKMPAAGTTGVQIGGNNLTKTSATANVLDLSQGIAPTSGTAVFNVANIDPTINQTGGASGITRGIYINPTLTAASDFRALEIAGNTYNLSSAGAPAATYGALFNAYTLASSSSATVTNASMLNITGAPIAGSNVLISSSSALTIQGSSVSGGRGVTNAYGLYVNAPTGATNNYDAVFTGGNVGIGSSSPTATLAVTGLAGSNDILRVASSTNRILFDIAATGNIGIGTTTGTGLFVLQGGSTQQNLFTLASSSGASLLNVGWYGDLTQNISSSSAVNIQDGSGNSVFAVDTTQSTSNAGLDITAGGSQTGNLLNVYSSGQTLLMGISAYGGLFQNIASTSAFTLANGNGTAFFNVDTLNSRVGIGTSTGAASLYIQANGSVNPFVIASSSGATSTFFFVGSTGNVGVGTSTPASRFVVAANCSGIAGNPGSCTDYAEIYPSARATDFGDVLTSASTTMATFTVTSIVDVTNSDGSVSTTSTTTLVSSQVLVDKAARAYDSTILGVVSTNPGVVLEGNSVLLMNGANYKLDPLHPAVALNGRVPVKVTNENGNIAPGDYLTSSAQFPGYAMKATRSGQVIGQALEAFNATSTSVGGKVLVFVNPGYQIINNTFVLGDNDGQLVSATSTSGVAQAPSFLIDQKGSGNILQLQNNEQDRFLVSAAGAVSILANVNSSNNVLTVSNGSSTLFTISSVGDAAFTGHIAVGQDTAGTATIKAGDTQTTVTFVAPYNSVPKVIVTPNGTPVTFAVSQKTATGFTIVISQSVADDVSFDWFVVQQPVDTLSVSGLATPQQVITPPSPPVDPGSSSTSTPDSSAPAPDASTPDASTSTPDSSSTSTPDISIVTP